MKINPAQQIDGIEEREAAKAVIDGGFWAEGKEAEAFKNELEAYLGVRYSILTNSGSSANLAALMALTSEWIPEDRRLNTGDEVITTALCFPTTVSPIVYAGCVPVFVDVEPGTWNIDPKQVEEMITEKTKAIIVAHNLGNPFNLDEIMKICEENNLFLIEDNCDALSSCWKGRKTGTLGHIGTSSFYPAHHISGGEGGAVYTNNPKIFRALQSFINWGRDCWCPPGHDDTCGQRYGWTLGDLPHGYDHKNTYSHMGFNLKMTDIQAAIGRQQLKRLPQFEQTRKLNHMYLKAIFRYYPQWFELPETYEGADPSWFGYVIKLTDKTPFSKTEFIKHLEEHGIGSRAFFCGNITKQPVLANNGRFTWKKHPDLKVSDDVMEKAFWIGVHPGIKEEEREYMNTVIHNFLNKYL